MKSFDCEQVHRVTTATAVPSWLLDEAATAIAVHELNLAKCCGGAGDNPCGFFIGWFTAWLDKNPKWNAIHERAFYRLCKEKR